MIWLIGFNSRIKSLLKFLHRKIQVIKAKTDIVSMEILFNFLKESVLGGESKCDKDNNLYVWNFMGENQTENNFRGETMWKPWYIALYCALLHYNVLGGLSKTDIDSVPSMCPLQILSLCFEVSYIKQ